MSASYVHHAEDVDVRTALSLSRLAAFQSTPKEETESGVVDKGIDLAKNARCLRRWPRECWLSSAVRVETSDEDVGTIRKVG